MPTVALLRGTPLTGSNAAAGTYGGRLCRMVDQYNPAAARDQEGTNGGV